MMLESWNRRRETALRRVGRFGASSRYREGSQDDLPVDTDARVSFGARSRGRRIRSQTQARFWMMVLALVGLLIFIFG